jgi:ATP-dependent DNA helicase RecQ
MPLAGLADPLPGLLDVIAHHWGFRTLRPLQERAMRAVLEGRDSLVVLPTGGGKSLCYQAPAVLRGGLTVVVSPLISLMKDQVDSLRACGVPAVQMDSSQTPAEQREAVEAVVHGKVRLLFVSPERLVLTDIHQHLQHAGVHTFAIDEAHCISHWGHDFRPEYRQLSRLKEHFPQASVHAYTATATERVRRDIASQLRLHNAEVLIGNFDRPNLTYRVLARLDLLKQVIEVLDRHPHEAGIIYCLRRVDVDDLTLKLQRHGCKALPYHAGLSTEDRKATQDAFAAEQCDLVVATVAFGMGIDRSNIRFVLHAAMPKSIEHYQQETGRAGRDGLEAECVLLHSGADVVSWRAILEKSAEEAAADPSFLTNALRHLEDIDRYARGAVCRHRALVQYFGQRYEPQVCGACDLCLGDTEEVKDALVVAQKILSCVARVKESFGVNHVVGVLRGEKTENIRKRGHDKLSTYGLLGEHSKAEVRDWIYQLIGHDVLCQQGDEYPVLRLNAASWEVMQGQRTVRLVRVARRERAAKSVSDRTAWEGVDCELFEAMRGLRRQLADRRKVQPYVVFNDATLRELARVRPSTLERMRRVYGIGDAKLRDYGDRFLQAIKGHCHGHGVPMDVRSEDRRPAEAHKPSSRPNSQREQAFTLFREQAPVEDVMHQTGRARGTVFDYLCEFIREEKPSSITAWLPEERYSRIAAAARQVGTDRLKPIFIALGEQYPYEEIRLVVTHLLA